MSCLFMGAASNVRITFFPSTLVYGEKDIWEVEHLAYIWRVYQLSEHRMPIFMRV